MRGNFGLSGHKCGIPRDRDLLMRVYYEENRTVRQVAKLFGVKHPSVLRALAALGIARRSDRWRSKPAAIRTVCPRVKQSPEQLMWRTFQFGQQNITGRNRLVSFNEAHEQEHRRSIADSIVYDDPLEILCALEDAMGMEGA